MFSEKQSEVTKMFKNNNKKCSCLKLSRSAVKCLVRKNIECRLQPVKLSYQYHLQVGAIYSVLKRIYKNFKSIMNIELDEKIRIICDFDDMLEWMYATKKVDRAHFIMKKVNDSLKEYNEPKKSNFRTRFYVKFGGRIDNIISQLKDIGCIPRYTPGVLYSLYAWGQQCPCGNSQTQRYPYWKSPSQWWLSDSENDELKHCNYPEKYTGPSFVYIKEDWRKRDKSLENSPVIMLDSDFIPPSPILHRSKKIIC